MSWKSLSDAETMAVNRVTVAVRKRNKKTLAFFVQIGGRMKLRDHFKRKHVLVEVGEAEDAGYLRITPDESGDFLAAETNRNKLSSVHIALPLFWPFLSELPPTIVTHEWSGSSLVLDLRHLIDKLPTSTSTPSPKASAAATPPSSSGSSLPPSPSPSPANTNSPPTPPTTAASSSTSQPAPEPTPTPSTTPPTEARLEENPEPEPAVPTPTASAPSSTPATPAPTPKPPPPSSSLTAAAPEPNSPKASATSTSKPTPTPPPAEPKETATTSSTPTPEPPPKPTFASKPSPPPSTSSKPSSGGRDSVPPPWQGKQEVPDRPTRRLGKHSVTLIGAYLFFNMRERTAVGADIKPLVRALLDGPLSRDEARKIVGPKKDIEALIVQIRSTVRALPDLHLKTQPDGMGWDLVA